MQPGITGTESWSVLNLVGGIVLFAVFVILVAYAMSRSTRE